MKPNKKRWFDKECNNLKLDVKKLGRRKGKDPKNDLLRETYHEKLETIQKNVWEKNEFWQKKFIMLEKSCNDPKAFWNIWKGCTEDAKTNLGTKINGDIYGTLTSQTYRPQVQGT